MSSNIVFLSECSPLYTTLGAPQRIPNVTFLPLNRSIRLEWSLPPNSNSVIIDSYIIRYKQSGAPISQTLGELLSFTTTIIVPNLLNGELYDFWVIARNRFGDSPFSPTITAIPGASPSPSEIVRRAYHSTTIGNGINDSDPTTYQKVGLEFTPPPSNNGATPIVFMIKYTQLSGGIGGIGGSSTDNSYVLIDSVQNNQIMRDANNSLAINIEGVKGNYIRKEIVIPSGPGFITSPYRFQVFTTNIYGTSPVPDISFVVDLYSTVDANTVGSIRPRFTAPSLSHYSTPANGGIVSIAVNDSSFRFRWKQYLPSSPSTGGIPDSTWSYRIQYTDNKDYWYYPSKQGEIATYPEYTRAYDTTSPGANSANFEYFMDISRNVINGRRYYVRYCIVNSNGDTSEYTEVTDTNLSITSVIPGKLPQPPPIFRASVDDRMVRLYFNWNTTPPSTELTGGLPILDYKIERYVVSRNGRVFSISTEIDALFENLIGPYYEDRTRINTNGIEYYYKVFSRTIIGYSTLFTTVTAIPSRKSDVVQNVSASVDDGQITLSWLPPTNIEPGTPIVQYIIEYKLYTIFNIEGLPSSNIVGIFSNPPTITTIIQDMNSILINDTLWALLPSKSVSIYTNSPNLNYTITNLFNNTPYVFRIGAVTQDTARRNLVGLIKVIQNRSPYLPRPTIVGKVPTRLTNVEYSVGSRSMAITFSSSDINNTEGIIRFIVDYRIYGSQVDYLTQRFEYTNSVLLNNRLNKVTFSILVIDLDNNVSSRPLMNTDSYEIVVYSENSVGYTNITDRIDLHEDLTFKDSYENLTLPRLVRPTTVPSIIEELRT
jgi:hypothetical protein